ncbi:MAG TPA: 16S rRNA (cytidine(1402)-2'-O)-methyltransferase [Hyphomicrobiales bacterium]|nr:16S rRNA (cytidine(1402)-2'-O)-methyltransferase [Hyphomicrobiales bacterium]
MPSAARAQDASSTAAPTARGFSIEGVRLAAPRLAPGLHVVATPIGNLADASLRALQTLAAADLVLAEDTRVTRRLLDRYAIQVPLQPYHEHNAAEMRPRALARLEQGAALALVSDAGTPLVSDPGFKLVRAVLDAGLAVTTVPGPSAVLGALAVAGLPTDRFFFEGFLPPKEGARRSRIAALAAVPGTLVVFETAPRLAAALADLADLLGPRPAAVVRELTKAFEEVRRGALPALAAHYAGAPQPRGEIVLVIGPPAAPEAPDEEEVDRLLRAALAGGSVKDAAAAVAEATGLPRRELYARALKLGGAGR